MSKLLYWLLTIITIIGAFVLFYLTPDMTIRSQFGDYISGFASVIAFIWLIAAYNQQGKELRLQREELSMQRNSLDLQREELRKISRFSALDKVSKILEQFDQSLPKRTNGLVQTANDLPKTFLKESIKEWKTILEVLNAGEVCDAYLRWKTIDDLCIEFLERLVSAINLYFENTGESLLPTGTSCTKQVMAGYNRFKDIPFICHYSSAANSLATDMMLLQKKRDDVRLAGFEAIAKIAPGSVSPEALAKLRKRDVGENLT